MFVPLYFRPNFYAIFFVPFIFLSLFDKLTPSAGIGPHALPLSLPCLTLSRVTASRAGLYGKLFNLQGW